jgi:nitrogen fixation protein NifB
MAFPDVTPPPRDELARDARSEAHPALPVALDRHPCFNPKACRSFGRVHLPVAPKCNIQCNYCNRDFDCVNESRPGVTSAVLSPGQAVTYLERVGELRDDIAVAGIAGPGDPFANPEETLETFAGIRGRFPEMILCLSTNGLGLTEAYVDALAELGVSHVTLTINAVDPDIAARVYGWIRHGKRVLRGRAAGEVMVERQLEALGWIKRRGLVAKVNGILLPGVNDAHLPEVARRAAELGADLMNCVPLIPTKKTAFEALPEPSAEMRREARRACRVSLPQMTHCARCRADAIGRLGEPMTEEALELMRSCARLPRRPGENRPHVAVATREGMLVNQHLGEARRLRVYASGPDGFVEVEARETPPRGDGRWAEMARQLHDCRAVLVASVGPNPRAALTASGIEVLQMDGLITEGLEHVFHGRPLPPSRLRVFEGCGQSCEGDGAGCG